MHKVLISAILAASTLAIAAPAAAQFTLSVGTQYGNGYGNQYANGNDRYGQANRLFARLNQVEQQINILDRRDILSSRDANQLRYQANIVERQLRQASYNGLSGYENRNFEYQIARLEQNIRYQANNRNRWGNNAYGNNNGYNDRDGDGRDDGAEHQRWHNQHDGNRDHEDRDDD